MASAIFRIEQRRGLAFQVQEQARTFRLTGGRGPAGLNGIGDLLATPYWSDLVSNTASQQAGLAALGVSRIVGLERFAEVAGITLEDDVNIQPAIDAAKAAMLATPGLYVKVPPGRYRLNRLRIPNLGGFFCDPYTVVLTMVVGDPDAPEVFVANDTPYDTCGLLDGFILRGGWNYGQRGYAGPTQEDDPWLHQYLAATGEGADPEDGAQVGQRALQLVLAYNGQDLEPGTLKLNGDAFPPGSKSDDAYRDRSPIESQNPRWRVANLVIEGFGGDGAFLQGSGENQFMAIHVFRVGGRGRVVNGYDARHTGWRIGDTGEEGLVFYGNGSAHDESDCKAFYGGGRGLAGHMMGLRGHRCSGVTFTGQIQDPKGGLAHFTATDECSWTGVWGWQGEISDMEADIAAITWKGRCRNNQLPGLRLGNIEEDHPTVAKVFRVEVETIFGTDYLPSGNQLMLTHRGFPDDAGIFNPDHYEGGLAGFYGLINGLSLPPRQYLPSANGDVTFVAANGADPCGLIARGTDSVVQPGAALVIYQDAGGLVHYAGGVSTPGVTANSSLVTMGLPLKLKSYTVATVPSASAAGAGASIYVVNEVGGAQGVKSDGTNWRRDSDRAIIS
jgi:hypothetical protein